MKSAKVKQRPEVIITSPVSPTLLSARTRHVDVTGTSIPAEDVIKALKGRKWVAVVEYRRGRGATPNMVRVLFAEGKPPGSCDFWLKKAIDGLEAQAATKSPRRRTATKSSIPKGLSVVRAS